MGMRGFCKYLVITFVFVGLSLFFVACSNARDVDNDWGDWIVIVSPSCDSSGEEIRVSKANSSVIEHRSIAVVGHQWSQWEIQTAATCTTEGIKARECLDCGNFDFSPIEVIPHQWGDWRTIVEQTCTTAGVEARLCLLDATHAEEFRVIEADHEWGGWQTISTPDCTHDGEEIRVCQRDSTHTQTNPISKLGHDYGDWLIQGMPTCEADGVQKRVCRNDNQHQETQPIASLGHDYSEWMLISPSTQTDAGSEHRICKRNIAHIQQREIPAGEFSGEGTETNPYLIYNAAHLATLSLRSNDNQSYSDKFFVQMADIDLEDREWIPIGANNNSFNQEPSLFFGGSYNGNGYKIKNLTIRGSYLYTGLFGYCTGEIKKVFLENADIDAEYINKVYGANSTAYFGAIAAYSGGSISDCFVSGRVGLSSIRSQTPDETIYWIHGAVGGGLVGINNGIIQNSGASCEVFAISNARASTASAGGLVGWNYNSVFTSFASGNVSAYGMQTTYAGGFVVSNSTEGIIIDCYASGNVQADSKNANVLAGGFAATSGGYYSTITLIKNCYALGDVRASRFGYSSSVAGFVANVGGGDIENCLAIGDVYAENCEYFGGFSGGAYKPINCYNYEGQQTTTTSGFSPTNNSTPCTLLELNSSDFYKQQLKWDEDVWNFENLKAEEGIFPTLILAQFNS